MRPGRRLGLSRPSIRVVDYTEGPDRIGCLSGRRRGRQRQSLTASTPVKELERLERLAAKIGEQRAVVDELYDELVDLVRSASATGASCREVAKATGLTYGRVQQILP